MKVTISKQLIERWKSDKGISITKTINDFFQKAQMPGHGKLSTEILPLLKEIPFTEEVKGNKDLRGMQLSGGVRDMDFSDWNFSYALLDFNLVNCNLSRTIFDYVKGGGNIITNKIEGSSFLNARLPNAYFANSEVTGTCFNKANLSGANFENVQFSNCTFIECNCKMAKFFKADLTSCNFQKAILDEAVLQSSKIDKTTDIRGTSIQRAFYKDLFDKSGNHIAKAVDLSLANYDETTRF